MTAVLFVVGTVALTLVPGRRLRSYLGAGDSLGPVPDAMGFRQPERRALEGSRAGPPAVIEATSQLVADTQALVWYLTDSGRLSSSARRAMERCVADDHPADTSRLRRSRLHNV